MIIWIIFGCNCLLSVCVCVCAVVIWSDMLGDLQYCQDTLSWHPPNISDCSAGEWREAPKAKQCCLLWFNVCYHIECVHKALHWNHELDIQYLSGIYEWPSPDTVMTVHIKFVLPVSSLPLMICSCTNQRFSCHACFNFSLSSGRQICMYYGNSPLQTECMGLISVEFNSFKIYGIRPQASKNIIIIHTHAQSSLASVGLTQAHPNY